MCGFPLSTDRNAGYSGAGRAAGMCFSATASFSAASITAVIGIATLRQVKHPRELPLAAMPLLFAVQQAVEGALWLQLPAGGGRDAVVALSLCFLVFAKVLWPACVAPAVLLIEPDLRRRQVLYALAALGGTISLYMLNRLIENPPPVAICGHSIDYGGNEYALSWQHFSLSPVHLCSAPAFVKQRHPEVRRNCGDRLPGLRHHLFRDLPLGLVFLCCCRQWRSLLLFQECRAACVAS